MVRGFAFMTSAIFGSILTKGYSQSKKIISSFGQHEHGDKVVSDMLSLEKTLQYLGDHLSSGHSFVINRVVWTKLDKPVLICFLWCQSTVTL